MLCASRKCTREGCHPHQGRVSPITDLGSGGRLRDWIRWLIGLSVRFHSATLPCVLGFSIRGRAVIDPIPKIYKSWSLLHWQKLASSDWESLMEPDCVTLYSRAAFKYEWWVFVCLVFHDFFFKNLQAFSILSLCSLIAITVISSFRWRFIVALTARTFVFHWSLWTWGLCAWVCSDLIRGKENNITLKLSTQVNLHFWIFSLHVSSFP